MSPALNEKPHAEELPASGAVGMIIEGHYLPPPEDKDGKLGSGLVTPQGVELMRVCLNQCRRNARPYSN